MPNLKDIKSRISNVSNAEKITFSMKSISAVKLSQVRRFFNSGENYLKTNKHIINDMLLVFRKEASIKEDEYGYNFFHLNTSLPKLIIVFGADRGLCGAFNSNVIKKVESALKNNKKFKILAIGSKVRSYFLRHYPDNVLTDFSFKMDLKSFTMQQALLMSRYIFDLFKSGQVGSLEVVYTKFLSVLSNDPTQEQILPVNINKISSEEKEEVKTKSLEDVNMVSDDYIVDALDIMIKDLILSYVYEGVIESLACEHAARVNAMDTSYHNAQDLLKQLSLEYNNTRQAMITRELIEIIAGTEAV